MIEKGWNRIEQWRGCSQVWQGWFYPDTTWQRSIWFKDALLKNDNSTGKYSILKIRKIMEQLVPNKVNTPTLGHLIIFYALKAKHRCNLNLYKMNLFHSVFLVLVRVSLRGGIVSLNLTFKVYILNSSWIRGNKIILVFAYHPLFMIMIKSRVWGSHDLRKIIP